MRKWVKYDSPKDRIAELDKKRFVVVNKNRTKN